MSDLIKKSSWIDPREQPPNNSEQVFIILPAVYEKGMWFASLDPYAWAKDPRVVPCDCHDNGRCNGTKERDECACGGNVALCDFYPEKAHFTL